MTAKRQRTYQCADCGRVQFMPRRKPGQTAIECAQCKVWATMRQGYGRSVLEHCVDQIPTARSIRE